MKYYLHDSNSFNDEKITELFINFGYEGLGLFYTLLEKIAAQEKPIKTEVLKTQLKIGKRLEKCWLFMESLELISSNNGETFNDRLINFAGKYKIKNEKNAKRISEWREKQTDKKNVTCNETVTERVRNDDKVNKSKVNKSKVNNIEEKKLNFSSISENIWMRWINYKFTQFNEKYKTIESEQIALNKLVEISKNNNETAEKIVNNSITNIYKGLFEIKEQNNLFSSQKQSNFINHDSDF